MKRYLVITMAGLFLGSIGCTEYSNRPTQIGEEPAIEGSDDGDEGAGLSPFITGGSVDPGHPTVGLLSSCGANCSATLIGNHTVLTAGHCVQCKNTSFWLGGSTYYRASKVTRHPNYGGGNRNDVAIVTLQKDVTSINPTPINIHSVSVGQNVTLVGYGKTGENSGGFGIKRITYNTISKITSTTYSFNGRNNVCNGDSGGPGFVMVDGEERVSGVHSTKSGACGIGGTDMRVDAYQDWIIQVAGSDVKKPSGGAPPTPPTPDANSGSGDNCHSGQKFGWDYCTNSCLCGAGEGDCDSNSQCKSGLVCKSDVGAKYGVDPTLDVCEEPSGSSSSCHLGNKFDWGYCTASCPCDEGEGDCDDDSECKGSLICKHNVGSKYGASDLEVDACESSGGTTPPSPNTSSAKEGESCVSATCESGQTCVPVYTSSSGTVIDKYCMENCNTLGEDPICDGKESCVQSRASGRVCFDPNNPNQGFTNPESGSGSGGTQPPSPTSPTPPSPTTCGDTQEVGVFKLLNQVRAANGGGNVACDKTASDVARAHSKDMCNRGFFSHTNPDGKSPWARMREGGVQFSSGGENIANGQKTPEAVHNAWMNSSSHRQNILNASWKYVGVGHYLCTKNNRRYWTEVFFR